LSGGSGGKGPERRQPSVGKSHSLRRIIQFTSATWRRGKGNGNRGTPLRRGRNKGKAVGLQVNVGGDGRENHLHGNQGSCLKQNRVDRRRKILRKEPKL